MKQKTLIIIALTMLGALICTAAYLTVLVGTRSHLAAIPFTGLLGILFASIIVGTGIGDANFRQPQISDNL